MAAHRKVSEADMQRVIWLVQNTTIPLADIGQLYGISQSHISNSLRDRSLPGRREIAKNWNES